LEGDGSECSAQRGVRASPPLAGHQPPGARRGRDRAAGLGVSRPWGNRPGRSATLAELNHRYRRAGPIW